MSTNIRVTRQSNKDAHPGMPDIDEQVLSRPVPKPRRTKAQIAADNAAAAAKKLAKAEAVKSNEEKKTRLVNSIAVLENEMDNDEQQAEKEAARPPAKKMVMAPQPVSKGKETHLFKHMYYWCQGCNEAVQRADNLANKKSKSNSLNTDNNKGLGGRKNSPDLGEASFVFDKYVD